MNWNSLVKVFILIFLIMNVGLYIYTNNYQNNRYKLSEERVDQMNELLRSNGISIYNFIPTNKPMSDLELILNELNKEKIISNIFGHKKFFLDNNFENGEKIYTDDTYIIFYNEDNKGKYFYKTEKPTYIPTDMTKSKIENIAIKFAKVLIGENIPLKVTYTEELGDGKVKLVINETYNGVNVFSSYIQLLITKDGIEEALVMRFKPQKYDGKQQEIYAFDEVMYSLMNYIKKNNKVSKMIDKTVKNIDIGYYIVDEKSAKVLFKATPYYRIIFENGDVYYIDAHTNAIISSELQEI